MTAQIPREIPDLPPVPASPLLPRSPAPARAVLAPSHRPGAAVYRLLTALIATAGVALAVLRSTPAHALSYFGVQASAILAVTMLLSASRAWRGHRVLPSWLTGAALLYALVSALTYHLLLARTSFSMTALSTPPERWHTQWITLQLLHTVAPAAALLDWLCLTPAPRLHLHQATTWLLYPLAYLAFYLARGAPYLYPFLDPAAHGYRVTLANALLLGLATYALATFLVALDHTRPTPIHRHL